MELGRFLQRLRVAPKPGARPAPKPARPAPALPPQPDLLSFRPDPSKMYLLGERDAFTRRQHDTRWDAIADVFRAPSLRSRYRTYERLTKKAQRDEAKRLCRLISPARWQELYFAFVSSVVRGSEARPRKWVVRDAALSAGWFGEPWYAIDPDDLRFPGELEQSGLKRLAAEMTRIHALGFRNLALDYDMIAPCTVLEDMVERGRTLGMRIAMGIDVHRQLVSSMPLDGRLLAEMLEVVAREVNSGFLGAAAHEVDRWAERLAGPHKAHALFSLIALFVHTIAPRDIIIPEISSRPDDLDRWFSEGDALHWATGSQAIDRALDAGRRVALDAALDSRPTPLYGHRLLLEVRKRRRDPQQRALAAALLYAMPATPLVGHRATSSILVALNALRRMHPALARGSLQTIDLEDRRTLAWVRRAPAHGPIVFIANLSDEARTVRVSAAQLQLGPKSSLRRLMSAPERTPIALALPLALKLPAHGFALLLGPKPPASTPDPPPG